MVRSVREKNHSDGTTLPQFCDRESDFETIRMGPTSERGKALSGELDVFDGHDCDDGGGCRFTNTAVPRFDGTGCWQRHLLIFQAIVKSNGCSLTQAALQLFAHLDGEALNVAFLMPVEEREQWTAFARGLSDYFNFPGRLAVVRRRFESASRRPGVDPATFATELGILAVLGFENMGECARDLMVRNKFIAAQQSSELRRHLDGASVDASIGDIVDSCRVWESHTKAGMMDPTLNFHIQFPRWRRQPNHSWGR